MVMFADHCDMCKKYFDRSKTEVFSVYYDDAPHSFCCKTCMNVYILANRKIVPCNWCKVRADPSVSEQKIIRLTDSVQENGRQRSRCCL